MPGYEKRKVAIDLFKHLGALSVAAIAVLVSFLPSLQKLEHGKDLLESAVVSFGICLISSIIACLLLLANIENLPDVRHKTPGYVLRLSTFSAILFFSWGVINLCRTLLVNIT